ncbi:MAG: 2OG-Fe(II) oxygenase [Actinobacteria bacterium]|nr:2OG-Fe(II) oxygenase [Actinomycetota bacterium]
MRANVLAAPPWERVDALDGRYRYFDHPLPTPIGELRAAFYRHLAPVANRWAERLGEEERYPAEHAELLERGEFVLLEGRPRAQSRAHVLAPAPGAFVIFPTHHRPGAGKRGWHRAGMRHGVSTVTSGSRTALGIIFHDAS